MNRHHLLLSRSGSLPGTALFEVMSHIVATKPPTISGVARRDPFLQLDKLEAALPLGLAGRRGLGLAAGLYGRLDLAWFHDGTSFRINSGLRFDEAIIPRRADRAPGRC